MSNRFTKVTLEDIVSLCKRRGFVFQGSEIYGGLAGTWDYGPLGVTLKKNLMDLWWKTFVEDRDDIFGVDAAILMNKKVWEASGHVDTFTDPIVECLNCNYRHRVDKLIDLDNYNEFMDLLTYDFIQTYQETALSEKEVEDLKNRIGVAVSRSNHATLLNKIKKTPEWKEPARIRELILRAKKYRGPIMRRYLNNEKIACPNCKKNNWSEPEPFNMMLKTVVGSKYRSIDRKKSKGMKAQIEWLREDGSPATKFELKDPYNELGGFILYATESVSYLRPETAQGIFTNFRNVVDTLYPDVPFGIAQVGKAFRNEISPRDFIFRAREFNQMEIEYFVREEDWEKSFEKWRKDISSFLEAVGVDSKMLSEQKVPKDDLAHYSKKTIDYEFKYPHGKDELLGLAYRTDFDLRNIEKGSGKKMEYRPKDRSKPFIPHVIEPSFGVERLLMAVLVSAYSEDLQNGEKRIYLKLPTGIAPVKYCVSPLLKNKPKLVKKGREVYNALKKNNAVMWDDNGNIGKRYRRQDEIGTPYCVVIDFDTLEDDTVTVRDRDTTDQKRVKIKDLV